MKLLRTGLAVLFLALAAPGWAASVPLLSGPFDPGQGQANFNNLIIQINAILAGVLPTTTGSVNSLSLTSTLTGGVASIALQTGADTNAAIGIKPNGAGNIVLFSGNPVWAPNSAAPNGPTLQLAGTSAFIKANGLAPCPGMATNRPPMMGVSAVVSGFFMVQDWLGYQYAVPTCGPSVSGTVARGG